MSESKCLFITGGRGLLGKCMVSAALMSERFSRIVTLGRSLENFAEHASDELIHEVGSVEDVKEVRRLLQLHKVTHLIHAAGARTSECREDPSMARRSNVIGTENVFRAASEIPTLEKAVFISTGAVYGDQGLDVYFEDTPLDPQSTYAKTKSLAERSVLQLVPASIVVRPGFSIGVKPSTLNQFAKRALTNESIAIRFCEQFFIHSAKDIGRATVELLLSEREGVFHLPGHTLRLEEFCSLLTNLAQSKGFSPGISWGIDEKITVPGNLSFDKFSESFPEFNYEDPETIFRSIIE